MAKIVCRINIGTLKHDICIQSEKYENKPIAEHYYLTIDEIPNFILSQTEITDVFMTGHSKDFLKMIEDKTHKLEYEKYQQNNKKFYYI